MNYIIYNTDGRILRSGVCPPEGFDLQLGEGEYILEGVACDTLHYISDKRVIVRPKMEVLCKNGSLYGIPNKTKVYVDGGYLGECTTGTVVLDKEDDSEYVVRLECFPYSDYEVEL